MAMSKVEEEETERLVMGTTKVVYYLEPLMSKELRRKFPDKSSAFHRMVVKMITRKQEQSMRK